MTELSRPVVKFPVPVEVPVDDLGFLRVGKGLLQREPMTTPPSITSDPLVDTLVEFMADKTVWDGTASELHMTLEHYAVDLPGDANRLSKALSKLASLIAAKGVVLERTRVAQRRGIRMSWAS